MTVTHSDRRSCRGITIVELMLGILLALVVFLGAGSMYVSTMRSFQIGARKLQAQQEASLLSGLISRRTRPGMR